MKRILLSTLMATSFFTLTAQAAPNWVVSPAFNGFYVGAGAGVTRGDADIKTETLAEDPDTGLNTFLPASTRVFNTHGTANLFVGYGTTFDRIYLGGEVLGTWTHNVGSLNALYKDGEIEGNYIETSYTRAKLNQFEGDVDVRSGLVLSPETLIYTRVGAAFNKVSIKTEYVDTWWINFENPLYLTNTISKHRVGLRLGVGLEQILTPAFSIRADYIFTNFGRVSNSADALYLFESLSDVRFTNYTSAKMRNHSFFLSGVYHFYL